MHPSRRAPRSLVAVIGSLFVLSGLLPIGAAPVVRAAGSVSLTAIGVLLRRALRTGTTRCRPNGDFESGANVNNGYRGNRLPTPLVTPTASARPRRSIGFRDSAIGVRVARIGASFTNDTGATITSLDIAYIGEQWRLGQVTAGRARPAERRDLHRCDIAHNGHLD